MQICDLELFLVEVPRAEPLGSVRSLLVRLAIADGKEGWGEAPCVWRGSELAVRRELALSALLSRSVFDIEELVRLESLDTSAFRAAIEMACWDLVGRITGQPLCRLFGGEYRRRIPIAVRLPLGPATRVVALAREMAEVGFHTLVIPSSAAAEEDAATVGAVRQAVGDGIRLRFDGAQQYSADLALELSTRLEPYQLECLIDPLANGGIDAVATLARQTSVPMAVSRELQSPSDVLRIARSGSIRHVFVTIERVGGLTAARKCGTVAEATGMQAAFDAGARLGVATAAMLQVAGSVPVFAHANESGYHKLRDDVLAEPLEVSDGMTSVPQGVGLGVTVDRAKIERFQIA